MPLPIEHIIEVIHLGARNQMIYINARPVVTSVSYYFWQVSVVVEENQTVFCFNLNAFAYHTTKAIAVPAYLTSTLDTLRRRARPYLASNSERLVV